MCCERKNENEKILGVNVEGRDVWTKDVSNSTAVIKAQISRLDSCQP